MTRLLCCLAALLLAACGASGALYLPDQEPPKPNAFGSKDPRKATQQPAQVPRLPSATPPPASPPATPSP